MGLDAASAIAVAAAVFLAALIVAIVVAASAGACCSGNGRPPGRPGAVHDVERALGDAATLVTYEQARKSAAADEEEGEAPQLCALCLSEFGGKGKGKGKAGGGELVRVVSACGHFFHADCGVDGWLRARGTCPICRAQVWTARPRQECPRLPARSTVGSR